MSEETFICTSCKHTLPKTFQVRTPGFCYLCDPNVTLEECLSDKPFAIEEKFKVFKVNDEHEESSWVYARSEHEALQACLECCVIEKEEIAGCVISIMPEESWGEFNIISNEPTEMPDMTLAQWMKEQAGNSPEVIASTIWEGM